MSKKITDMAEKLTVIDADYSEIVDSEELVLADKNKKVSFATKKAYYTGGYINQIYNLTNWDMTTDSTKIVGFGLFPGGSVDISKVVSFSVIIFDDASTVVSNIFTTTNVASAPMPPQGTAYLTNTDVQIIRLDGGLFDNANYNGAGLRARINIISTT